MKAYIPRYLEYAGRWIYDGYSSAWQHLGFEVSRSDTPDGESPHAIMMQIPDEVKSKEHYKDYIMMAIDECINVHPEYFLEAAHNSHKTFIYVQPHTFPSPWGSHPNFISRVPDGIITELKKLSNVHFWAFSDAVNVEGYYEKWGKVNCVPLAFDSIGYQAVDVPRYKKFDVSFVGGWANNGFNEKKQIIIKTFSAFQDAGLKCGFFVNKNLTHEQECGLLANSKITLNIHDAYQRILGYDTNERTFKSLGLNGAMVGDSITQLNRLFPDIKTSSEPKEMVRLVKELLSLSEAELNQIKEKNKQDILDNHCYTNRVRQLLEL